MTRPAAPMLYTPDASTQVASALALPGLAIEEVVPPLPTPEILLHPSSNLPILPTSVAYLPLKRRVVFQPLDDPARLLPEWFDLMNRRASTTPPLAATLIGTREKPSQVPEISPSQNKPAEAPESPDPVKTQPNEVIQPATSEEKKPSAEEAPPKDKAIEDPSPEKKPVASSDNENKENKLSEAAAQEIHPSGTKLLTKELTTKWKQGLSQHDVEKRKIVAAEISNFLNDHPDIMNTPIQRKAMVAFMVNLLRDSDETIRFFAETPITLGRVQIPRLERNQSPYKELRARIKQLLKIKDPLYAVDDDERQMLASINTNWDQLTTVNNGDKLNQLAGGLLV